MSDKKYTEIILICTRCKHERSVVVTQENRTKPPKPCPRCGGQDWTQKAS